MHKILARTAVSTERALLKAVSIARLIFRIELCISIAYILVALVPRDGGGNN